jgi:hypothetical protein
MKTCRACEKKLPVSEFKRDRGTCRGCLNRRARERRANDPEYAARVRERWNSWYQRSKNDDPEFNAREWERERARRERLRAADPEAYLASRRDVRRRHTLKTQFGLTDEQYAAMLEEQDGRCAICRRPEIIERNGRRVNLAVDHDHATGRVRGLLCSRCNNGVGRFDDDPDRLRAAAEYIEMHR